MKRFAPHQVKDLIAKITSAVGVPSEDALILADSLVEADLQGTATHGVSRAKIYVRRIQKGLIKPAARLRVEQRQPAVLSVDAGNGLGQVQALKVLERLMPIAQTWGVASAAIRNSQHFGALSYYCNRAAQKEMILIAATSCEPSMAPTGSAQAFFGTNPIAVSFPTGKGYPIKVDLATSIVARGNIIAAHKNGKNIPAGWALDADGHPTTDAGQALLGTVLTMAGHKGYALALMVEVLASVLSGSAIGPDIGSMYKHMDRKQDIGHFFCLLDIEAFMEVSLFKQRVDGMIDAIKACRRRPDVDEILIPGERSYKLAMRNRREGVPIDEETLKELQLLCGELAISNDLD